MYFIFVSAPVAYVWIWINIQCHWLPRDSNCSDVGKNVRSIGSRNSNNVSQRIQHFALICIIQQTIYNAILLVRTFGSGRNIPEYLWEKQKRCNAQTTNDYLLLIV